RVPPKRRRLRTPCWCLSPSTKISARLAMSTEPPLPPALAWGKVSLAAQRHGATERESFRCSSRLPPVFDAARAQRVLEDLVARCPELATSEHLHLIITAAAGNCPYVSGLMLKEAALVSELLVDAPKNLLQRLNA